MSSLSPEQQQTIQNELQAGRSFSLAAATAEAPLEADQHFENMQSRHLQELAGGGEGQTVTLASGTQVFVPDDADEEMIRQLTAQGATF